MASSSHDIDIQGSAEEQAAEADVMQVLKMIENDAQAAANANEEPPDTPDPTEAAVPDEGGGGDQPRPSEHFLRTPVRKESLSSVKQAPSYKQDEMFCTKVQVELYCCNYCHVCFETIEAIKQHLQDQPEHRAPRKPKEKPYKCKTCGKGYASSVVLNKHVRKVHRKPPVRRPKPQATAGEKLEGETAEEEEEGEAAQDEEAYVVSRTRSGSSRMVIKCEECGMAFATSARLKIHMAVHTGEAEFECDQCNETFTSQWVLKKHLKNVHNVERKASGRGVPSMECDMCEHVATDMNDFRAHQATHEGQELKCRICGRTAADFRRLRKHFRQQHRPGKKWHVCDICGHKSSGPSSLALHMATHTGQRNFKCETCGMRFVRKYAMDRHNEVKHLQIRRYMCTHCGQKFGTNFALQKHEEYHAEESEKQFFCTSCGEGFVRDNVLRWHLQYYHGNNPKTLVGKRLACDRNRGPVPGLHDANKRQLPFPCSLCKRSFSSHAVRERHIRAFHSDDTSLLCKVCGVRFGAQSKFDQHVASHNGLTSHKCRYCNKEFKRDHLRQVHESEKHTGARPWKCTCCEERFVSKARMYAHRLVHYGREIKCDFCDRNFSSLPLKKRHMRKHSGLKEFQCHICNKEYKQKSNFTAHMKIHTGEKPFHCDRCDERFVDLPTLRKHLSTHHQPVHQQLQPQPIQQHHPQHHHQQIPQHTIHQNQQAIGQQQQSVQIIPQHLPQSVQPVQHIQIIQQPQQQEHEHDIIRAPVVHQTAVIQPVGQVQQLNQIQTTGESIDLVAYNCDVCGQMFLSTDALISHCQTHVMEAQGHHRPNHNQRHTGGGALSLFGVVGEAQYY